MKSFRINIFKKSSSNLYLLGLTFFFFAAWIGQSFYYIPIADDFAFRKMVENGLWNTVWEWYGKTGIRRSFGVWTNAPICASPEWLTNIILILLHYISTVLIFSVTLKITRSNYMSYMAGLILGVFPFGYGAITWACGSYTISVSILFLSGLLFLLRYAAGKMQSQWLVIILSSICFFLCCVCGEHYVFAIAFSCNQESEDRPLARIQGQVSNLPGTINSVKLKRMGLKGPESVDSAEIEDGKFSIEIPADSEFLYRLEFGDAFLPIFA